MIGKKWNNYFGNSKNYCTFVLNYKHKNMIHKIGDKVIALESTVRVNTQPRVKGEVYVVQQVYTCQNCNCQYINYGYKTNLINGKCVCDSSLPSMGLKWTPSKYFANITNEHNIKDLLLVALEEEDYKFAIILRDLNKSKKIC